MYHFKYVELSSLAKILSCSKELNNFIEEYKNFFFLNVKTKFFLDLLFTKQKRVSDNFVGKGEIAQYLFLSTLSSTLSKKSIHP